MAGDPHEHAHGCFPRRGPDELQYAAARQEIAVAAALVWGEGYDTDFALFTGADNPVSKPGSIVHYDLEVSRFPAANPGHLVVLGLHNLAFSPDPFATPKSGIPVVEWARAQGALVGMAHGQFWPSDGHLPNPGETCCIPLEFPVHVARGQVTFLETERTGSGPVLDPSTFLLWKTLQNAGFPVVLIGGSDLPCLGPDLTDDTPRTDVIVDGALTYDRWLDGIRKGRTTVVTRGVHLNLRVNGAPLGSDVHVATGAVVTAALETRFREPTEVELVVNGETAWSGRVDAGSQVRMVPLRAAASFWVFARSHRAATSATYVIAGEQPIRASAADACYLVRYVGHLEDVARGGQLPLGESQAEALDAYEQARKEFSKRFFEAGGQSCL